MQDKYVGDIGDYGKYGLLKQIYNQANGNITLGINWYYVDINEGNEGDGKYVEYLNKEEFRNLFPEIFEELKKIVKNKKRSIREVMEISKNKGTILPKNTVFYDEPVSDILSVFYKYRKEKRKGWFEKSLEVLQKADIIFLDPDNGIQTEKLKETRKMSIKYALYDEINEYYKRGKSVIVYNHRDRKPLDDYKGRIEKLKEIILECEIRVIKFKRYSVRHYVFLIHKKHRDLIMKTIEYVLNKYGYLFEYGY